MRQGFRNWILFLLLLGGLWLPPLTAMASDAVEAEIVAVFADLNAWRVEQARSRLLRIDGAESHHPDLELIRAYMDFHDADHHLAVGHLEEWLRTQVAPAVPPRLREGGPGEGLPVLPSVIADFPPGFPADEMVRSARLTVGWYEHRTENFRIRYAPGPDAALVPYLGEALERIRRATAMALGHEPAGVVTVELFPSGMDFISATPLTADEVRTTGTIALCKWNRLLVTAPRTGGYGYPWLDTVAHEYLHLVISQMSGNRIPVWLHEGTAKALEGQWRGGEVATLGPRSETLLSRALGPEGRLVTFDEMHPSMAKLPSAEEAGLAFAEVTTAVGYLLGRHGLPAFARMLRRAGELGDVLPALEELDGRSFAEFETAWREWLPAQGFRELTAIDEAEGAGVDLDGQLGSSAEEADGLTESGDTASQYARLGDLLRARQHNDAALIEYERAVDVSPFHEPGLARRQARCLLDLSRDKDAQSLLEDSVGVFSEQGLSYLLLSKTYRAAGDTARERQALERVLSFNPYDAEVHQRLREIYRDIGRDALAERETIVLRLLAEGRYLENRDTLSWPGDSLVVVPAAEGESP